MGAVGTLQMMIGFRVSVENFVTGGSFFVVTSLVSSGSQKKDNSNSYFRCRDADEVETFDSEAISFLSSASGIQKKESLETDFIRGVTGDETKYFWGRQSISLPSTQISSPAMRRNTVQTSPKILGDEPRILGVPIFE